MAALTLILLLALSVIHPSHSFNSSIQMPSHPLSFNSADSPCNLRINSDHSFSNLGTSSTLKLHLKHRPAPANCKHSVLDSAHRDLSRIQTLYTRMVERKNQNADSRLAAAAATAPAPSPPLSGRLMATLESGVSLGSGEYFIDVFIGTPPRHLSLILDTGSDLNWIQCLPCHDCFDQHDPFFDPAASSSYANITCGDPRCKLVSSPDPPRPCSGDHQPCPYYYWYGDRSNTTGDLALETFTVNLTSPAGSHRVNDVIFGCGHWNRGLFHGAAGLIGLGRGPLSFSSQLRALYGHTFSYCLVDRNSDISVTSKLIFGEDPALAAHPNLNYTSFIASTNQNPADTFYYVHIKAIKVGGEVLDIPPETLELSAIGSGGTIIDSGTTLSYFADPAYNVIREAFVKKVKYPMVEDFPVLSPCYNVTGVKVAVLPELSIVFADGTVWDFPSENYFIRLDPEEIMCLAILGTPQSSLSIIGNYQQQNFHIMYDTKNSRLGFAPTRCAQV